VGRFKKVLGRRRHSEAPAPRRSGVRGAV